MNNKNNSSDDACESFVNDMSTSSGEIFKDLLILELKKIGVIGKSAENVASQLSKVHTSHLFNCLMPLVKTMEMMGVKFSKTDSIQEVKNMMDSADHVEIHNPFGDEDPGKNKGSSNNSWPTNLPNPDDFFGNRFLN